MGWAATVFSRNHPFYVTGELTVKYISPVLVEEEIEVIGRLIKDAGRIVYGAGELLCGEWSACEPRVNFSP